MRSCVLRVVRHKHLCGFRLTQGISTMYVWPDVSVSIMDGTPTFSFSACNSNGRVCRCGTHLSTPSQEDVTIPASDPSPEAILVVTESDNHHGQFCIYRVSLSPSLSRYTVAVSKVFPDAECRMNKYCSLYRSWLDDKGMIFERVHPADSHVLEACQENRLAQQF
jgi:hypothetical protein